MEAKQWFATDSTQFANKVNDNSFEFVEMVNINDEVYVIYQDIIDYTDYTETDILEYIESYGYESVEVVKKTYGDEYKQVICECIFESISNNELFSSLNEQSCIQFMKNEFGISIV